MIHTRTHARTHACTHAHINTYAHICAHVLRVVGAASEMMRAAREEAAAARMARLYPTAPEVRVSVRGRVRCRWGLG